MASFVWHTAFVNENIDYIIYLFLLALSSSSIKPLDKRALSSGPGKLRITNSITRSSLTVQAAANAAYRYRTIALMEIEELL